MADTTRPSGHRHSHTTLTIRDVIGQSHALLEAPIIPVVVRCTLQELHHRDRICT